MKLLMIANSFGVNLQTYAKDIAIKNNFDFDIYVLYIPGCSLKTHYSNILSEEKAYELFINGKTSSEMISIKDALLLHDWDLISLQQASHESGLINTYYPYLGEIYSFIKIIRPKAKIGWHQTWAYSPINTYKYSEVPTFYNEFNFKNEEEMKINIDNCLNKINGEFKFDFIIRSGDIIYKAVRQIGDCYDEMGFHMNDMGCLLIGYNLVKLLSKRKISANFTPNNISEETSLCCMNLVNDFQN